MMPFETVTTKGDNKGIANNTKLLIYATWPNVGEFRPFVWRWCMTCESERYFPDAIVFAADHQGKLVMCLDCQNEFERQAIWNPLWRC